LRHAQRCARQLQPLASKRPGNVGRRSRNGAGPALRALYHAQRRGQADASSIPSDPTEKQKNGNDNKNRNHNEDKAASIPQPTSQQLRIHGINCAVPMIGFGFMDNMVMIQAGDFIDNHIGVSFGLTTLTAAALGQVCSDVSGVCFGGVIETLASKLGLPSSTLTNEQLASKRMKLFSTGCAAIGVVIGCVLGMVSLLFMDLERAERQKKAKRLGGLFDTLVRDGRTILGAQRCNLWLVTEDGKHLWSRAFTGEIPNANQLRVVFDRYDEDHDGAIEEKNLGAAFEKLGWDANEHEVLMRFRGIRQDDGADAGEKIKFSEFKYLISCILKEDRRIPIREGGAKHTALKTGRIVNIKNAYTEQQNKSYSANYSATTGSTVNFDRYTGYDTFSVLLVPVVVDDPRRVIGLIEFANKSADGIGYQEFSKNDEKVAQLVASVASSFIADTLKAD